MLAVDYLTQEHSLIESFEIRGLHLSQNVRLEIRFNVVIFIADNGSGKTTALYMLQSILSRQYANLLRFSFNSFAIKFRSIPILVISRDEITSRRTANSASRILARTGLSYIEMADLARFTRRFPLERARLSKNFIAAARKARIPSSMFYEELQRYNLPTEAPPEDIEQDLLPLSKLDSLLKDRFHHKIIYLPTYRRVEQDLKSFAHADS